MRRRSSATDRNRPQTSLARAQFAALLAEHLATGTRPGAVAGEPRTYEKFAKGVPSSRTHAREDGKVSPRAVSNWCKGSSLPTEIEPILRVLFGPVKEGNEDRETLRAAFLAARQEVFDLASLQQAIDEDRNSHPSRRTCFDRASFSLRTDPLFRIVSSSNTDEEPFPIWTFVVMNRHRSPQVIISVECDVIEYCPYASLPQTRVLKPLAVWDIDLHYGTGLADTYYPSDPILLAANDAGAIDIRFRCGNRSPRAVGAYLVRIGFCTDQCFRAVSQPFAI
jgi:hypothetical protein